MHPSTFEYPFEYLAPSELNIKAMNRVREAAGEYATVLDLYLPEGPDKTYLMRKLREVAMWANVAITRNADGSPRA